MLHRFPDYLDRPTPVELQQQIEQLLVDDADHGETVKFYDAWSEKCVLYYFSVL